jgi:Zn-dependent protease/predicted transcriptional regulator
MKKGSLFIGSFFGVKLFIHWTFWIIIGWILLLHFKMGHGWTVGLTGVVFIIALFACIVLHEFGHALTAKKFGISTRNITLYPIGGVASLEKMPDKPEQELAVALAGPAVNVAIAGVLYFLLYTTDQLLSISEMNHMSGENFWFNLMAANVILAVFNLIPAFPMDGGRVLRALLAFKMGKLRATTIAARVGQFLAIIFVFFGFFTNFWLVFIGLFIYLGAEAETIHESFKDALNGYVVKDVLIQQYTLLSPLDTLKNVVNLFQTTSEQGFLVAQNKHVLGVISRKELIEGLSVNEDSSPVSKVMRKEYIKLYLNMPLYEAYQKLITNQYSIAPVLEYGQLKGIVYVKSIHEFIEIKNYKIAE